MSIVSEYLPLVGGLDEASSATIPMPGRLLSAQNVEMQFGDPGYITINGYERVDGRPLVSLGTYTDLNIAGDHRLHHPRHPGIWQSRDRHWRFQRCGH